MLPAAHAAACNRVKQTHRAKLAFRAQRVEATTLEGPAPVLPGMKRDCYATQDLIHQLL